MLNIRPLRGIILALCFALCALAPRFAEGQNGGAGRFPVLSVGSSVDVSTLGIQPDATDNDFDQGSMPSLARAQATSAAINAALLNYRQVIITVPGTYYIGSHLLINRGGRSLEGVDGVVLKMHTSMLDYMLRIGVDDLSAVAGRNLTNPTFDSDTIVGVTVKGIEFQRSGVGGNGGPGPGGNGLWPGHSLWIQNCLDVSIDSCRFTGYDSSGRIIGGKFAIQVNNAVRVVARDCTCMLPSDFFHLHGPTTDCGAINCGGFTGDNAFAQVQNETPPRDYNTTSGHMRRNFFKGWRCDVARKPDGSATTWWNGSAFVTPAGGVQPVRWDGDPDLIRAFGTLTSNSAANPTVVTKVGHGLSTGDKIYIVSHSIAFGSPGSLNSTWYTVTRVDDDTFTVPVDCTGNAGTGGAYVGTYDADLEISDTLIEDISGPLLAANHGIAFVNGGSGTGPIDVKRSTIRDVKLTNAASTAVVIVGSTAVKDVDIDGVDVISTAAAYALRTTATSGTGTRITARNIRNLAAITAAHLILVESPLAHLRVENATLIGTGAGAVRFLNCATDAGYITQLDMSNILFDMSAGNGATSRFVNTIVGDASAHAGTYIGSANITNLTLNTVGLLWDSGDETQAAPRNIVHIKNLVELGSTNEHVTGRVDVTIDGIYRNFQGKFSDIPFRTGFPSCNVLPQWSTATITHADIGAGATINFNINTATRYAERIGQGYMPMGGVVLAVKAKTITPFTGGGITAANLHLGNSDDNNQYTQAAGATWYDVFAAAGGLNYSTLLPIAADGRNANHSTDPTLTAQFTFTTGTDPTAGEVQIWWLWSVTQ